MADKLEVYNLALLALGDAALSTLSDSGESRRTLDDHWNQAVNYCLEQGLWHFAARAVELSSDPQVTPSFGYTYAFDKPDDLVRVSAVWQDSNETEPLDLYAIEGDYFYASLNPIYVRYISNGQSYGFNLGRWSSSFTQYVVAHLAYVSAPRITQGDVQKREQMRKEEERALLVASNVNVMDQPARFPPTGQWVKSRSGGLAGRSSFSGTGRGL